MDGQRRTDDGPWLYYKLTNEPRGSGELKMKGLRPEYCQLWLFFFQGQITPMTGLIWPELELVLCLSFTKIWPIMNMQAWRHHFPITNENIFRCSRACNTEVNDLIWLEFEFMWDYMPVLNICKFDEDLIKNEWEKVETPLKVNELLVAVTTTVLIQSAPKPNAAFPLPIDATHKIWLT